MAEPKAISAAQALKAFASQGIRITDHVRGKDGKVVLENKKGPDGAERMVATAETRRITEADVMSAVSTGDKIVMVTIDGKRYTNAPAAEAA